MSLPNRKGHTSSIAFYTQGHTHTLTNTLIHPLSHTHLQPPAFFSILCPNNDPSLGMITVSSSFSSPCHLLRKPSSPKSPAWLSQAPVLNALSKPHALPSALVPVCEGTPTGIAGGCLPKTGVGRTRPVSGLPSSLPPAARMAPTLGSKLFSPW